ncbi:MAG TPA: hypothetical protein VFH44_07690, partial [Solirubrobacterales bacterium]|nr:hypothetical protein [Solirubrobacterales bacterium]
MAVVAGVAALALTGGSDDPPPVAEVTPAPASRRADRDRPARPAHRAAARRHARIVRAGAWAAGREGRVAFAIAGPGGSIHGRNEH